jgi:RNA polymerase-binding transcription factor DksA
MPSTSQLSQDQRIVLADLLQSQLAGLEQTRASQLQGQMQVESARQTLLQDADDASQRAGEHEVEGIVSDIDSGEFNEIRNALQRIHGDGYGICVDCHVAIPFERLLLEPQALRCVSCEAHHERQPLP